MTKETKVIIGIIAGTIIFIGGLAVLMTKNSSGEGSRDSYIQNTKISDLTVSPSESMDLGQVAYGGGKVSKSFEVKNNSDKTIKLRKITTSCMCTTAKFTVNGKESKFFGMEMNGDLNPLIDYDLQGGQSATVTFVFDPAAHGPQGMGPFDRIVTLYFDAGYEELKFNGQVIK